MKPKVKFYVTAVGTDKDLWMRRDYKSWECPEWEEISAKKAAQVIKTHKFKYDTYPDNDDYHCIIEYDVKVKKVTEEIL